MWEQRHGGTACGAIAHTQEQLQQVQQQAEAKRERDEKLAERLRSLGIDPNAP